MIEKRMYEVNGKTVHTWNPFVGCCHDCIYCYAVDIAKRQKHRCQSCYEFVPHMHNERLKKQFGADGTVFVCSMGDIAFSTHDQFSDILWVIEHKPKVTFLIQSKNPLFFAEYEETQGRIAHNVVLGTTLETDMYKSATPISYAPMPELRYKAMKKIDHPRKYVTIEPIMEFDIAIMVKWIQKIAPEFVYLGYNSKDSKNHHLPEPSSDSTEELIAELEKITEVRRKLIRNAWWEKK